MPNLTNWVLPDDIDTSPGLHYWDTFDSSEREVSARWIVRFCQQRGKGWAPFTQGDIEKFYNEGGYKHFLFNGLVDPKYGIKMVNDEYHIGNEFVRRLCKWFKDR